jgi:hypothetical protein
VDPQLWTHNSRARHPRRCRRYPVKEKPTCGRGLPVETKGAVVA